MIGSLKHINPKTKILFFAIILIMIPGAILSYLGLQSIDQNRENLRTKYGGTINGIQIEMHRVGLRDTQNNRENFAEDLAKVIDSYMNENFGIDIVTSVEDEDIAVPERFILSQNYPNPFNLETSIRIEMPHSGNVSLKIYSLSGQLIKTILSQKLLQAGSNILRWDGRNESGNVVGSGIYFYRILTRNKTATGKMLLIK